MSVIATTCLAEAEVAKAVGKTEAETVREAASAGASPEEAASPVEGGAPEVGVASPEVGEGPKV